MKILYKIYDNCVYNRLYHKAIKYIKIPTLHKLMVLKSA